VEVSDQFHAPAALMPGKYPGNHWTEGRVGPRAGLFFPQNKKPLFTHMHEKGKNKFCIP